jgi:predicted RNA binding protein YcfA (HicA-like mRNA interferase family)
MKARDLLRAAKREGWRVCITGGGHLRLQHPQASAPVFAASTPSDHRAIRHACAEMRRQLRRKEGGQLPGILPADRRR